MWTNEEKQRLIALYPAHTDKELQEILGKTSGQIRGMKERLGLRRKFGAFTEEEIQAVKEYYEAHPDSIDLDELVSSIGRQKTSIARVARRLGLTKQSRSMTDEQKQKDRESQKLRCQSDYYKEYVVPKLSSAANEWHQTHAHPRGMLGKHHTDEARARMSKTHTELWANKTEEERRAFGEERRKWLLEHGHVSTSNTYSRCRRGIRQDLGMFFRSRWEANIARLLNQYHIAWEYEPVRFRFPDCGDNVLSYRPDFYLPDFDIWIEVRGWFDENSRKRSARFAEYYPEENAKLIMIDETLYDELEKQYASEIPNWELKNSELEQSA